MKRWRDLSKLRRRVYLPLLAAVALLPTVSLCDVLLSRRRVVRFRAAWAYDTQHEECSRLAASDARVAEREVSEAERWPEGSVERESHLRDANVASSLARANQGVAGHAKSMAKELRRLARTPP
jgi:hypothetical protein